MLPPYEFAKPEIGIVSKASAATVATGLTVAVLHPLLLQFCTPTTLKFASLASPLQYPVVRSRYRVITCWSAR